MAVANSTTLQAREDRAIFRALKILESRAKTERHVITGTTTTRDFLRLALGGEDKEIFAVVFLDSANRVITFEKMFSGTLSENSVYPREVVRRALFHNAAAVILAHNHPGGVAAPSQADRWLTTRLAETLALVDIRVLDHFIVTHTEAASFHELGLLGMPEDQEPAKAKPARAKKAACKAGVAKRTAGGKA